MREHDVYNCVAVNENANIVYQISKRSIHAMVSCPLIFLNNIRISYNNEPVSM